MIFTKDSAATSWVETTQGSEFPLQNLPYGVFRREGEPPRIGVAIGDRVLDLACLHAAGLFEGTVLARENVFARKQLNDFMALGETAWAQTRRRLVALLAAQDVAAADGDTVKANDRLRRDRALAARALLRQTDVEMLMPCWIGAFVDFYSSKEHATNVGALFRDARDPLPANWVHLPIAYHGRSASVVVSGTDIRRPHGQTKKANEAGPVFGPTEMLDFELEMGFFTGPGNPLGTPIDIDAAPRHIFGLTLLNDWSARDIQKWEYVPLGPFLSKSFGTSISPWVVPLDALQPFRVKARVQEPPVLPYLQTTDDWGLDIELEVLLQTPTMSAPVRLAGTNFRNQYWTMVQQLAHVTCNGANVEPGDLYGSGTVSGPDPGEQGCLLERSFGGTKPWGLPNGEQRTYLADGDTVILRGTCPAEHFHIGFGEVRGRILAAER